MKKKVNVAIIGCGNIAGGFDMSSDTKKDYYLSHMGAYSQDARFNVVACIDPNNKHREKFSNYWNIPNQYNCLSEIHPSKIDIDVISICSPTSFHEEHIYKSIKLKPKLIFCEKPISESLEKTKKIIDECKKNNILFVVNYTRRWDPDIIQLKNEIEIGQHGSLRSINAVYNKGLLNNGSHLIDLLHYLLGKLTIIATEKPIYDYTETDPTIPILLKTSKNIPIHVNIGNADDFSIFEIQFIFSKKIICMQDGGQHWYERKVIKSKNFKGYKTLSKPDFNEGKYGLAMSLAIEEIFSAINSDITCRSNGETAYDAQKMCDSIKNFNL